MNWLGQRFFRRRLPRSVMLSCLLSLLSALIVLGASQYLLSQEQFKRLDELNYSAVKLDDSHFADTTTVHDTSGVPSDWSEYTYISGLEEELSSFHENSEEVLVYDHRQGMTMLFDTLHRAPEHSDMSVERVLSVLDNDTSDMTFAERAEYEKQLDEHKPLRFSSAVNGTIAARCLKIEYHTVQQQMLDVEQQFVPYEALIYTAYFEIDHTQSQLSAVCEDIRYMKLSTWCLDDDFRPLFQEDREYRIAATGTLEFSYPEDYYESRDFPFYGKTIGLHLIDNKPQYYIEASLFGEFYYDLRFDLQEISFDERGSYRHENTDLREIPHAVRNDLPLDFDDDKSYVANIYGDESGPVWDLSQNLSATDLAQKEALFADYNKYISMNSRTFHAVLCRDPLLFPDFSDGNLYLEDKTATLDLLDEIDGSACIIPTQMAEYYDINPGDKITAALAHTGYNINYSYGGDEREIEGEIFDPYGIDVKLPTSLQEYDYLDQLPQQEFTVVGSFNYKSEYDLSVGTLLGDDIVTRGDKYFGGDLNVIDTIFVYDRGEGFDELPFLIPESTAPYQDFLSNRTNMLSVRLKNGSANVSKYLSDIEEAGLEECVLKVDDHGYAAIEPVLQEMERESISQLIIFLGSAVLLLIFYFFMLSRFFRSDLERMYVLGTEQRIIRGSIFSVLGRYWLSASVLTAVISAVLLPQMEKNLQRKFVEINQPEQSILPDKLPLLITVFAAIMLSSLMLSYLYSRRLANAAQG